MNNKTRSLIKGLAILMVILAVLMQMSIVIIPNLVPYKFWIVVVAFGLVVITSR